MQPFQPSLPSPPHVLLLGEAFIDCYLCGDANRLSPEAPIPVVSVNDVVKLPGGAANVAQNLLALGASITSILVHSGQKNRLMVGHHQLARWDERDGCLPFGEASLTLPPSTEQFDAVVISDYAKGLFSQNALNWLSQYRALPFFIDTKASPAKYAAFPTATFFPNSKEFRQHKAEYCALTQPFVLKRGADGMEYWPNGVDGPLFNECARASHVNNVTGAGDTVLSAFCLAQLRFENPRFSLQYASAAAACAVEQSLTSAPTAERVAEKLQEKQ